MRLLLLLLVFMICYIVDPKPNNSLSTEQVIELNRTDSLQLDIDAEIVINTLRFYTK